MKNFSVETPQSSLACLVISSLYACEAPPLDVKPLKRGNFAQIANEATLLVEFRR